MERPTLQHSSTPYLPLRSRALRAIREFFFRSGFVEVETPIRLRAPALEAHIDAEPAGDAWLRTSPELHMKRLLAAGLPRIWQMGACFRRGERGALHRPEYTMLEWYRVNAGYEEILADTRELLLAVAREVTGGTTLKRGGHEFDLAAPWARFTVSEAFPALAGWDPAESWDEDRFNLDLVERVEPALPRDVPVVLADYPAPAAALSRRKPDDPRVAERWELYLGGLELANAYSELTDPVEQRQRFVECADDRRARGRDVYPLDEDFLRELATMPAAGGIALGVDRLVMVLAGAATIDEVVAFSD